MDRRTLHRLEQRLRSEGRLADANARHELAYGETRAADRFTAEAVERLNEANALRELLHLL